MRRSSPLPTGGRRSQGAAAVRRVDRSTLIRLIRYTAVSLVATTTSLATLAVLVGVLSLPATWSNVVATAVGTVPSFELNRRWVWTSRTRRSLRRQVVPFCALSFSGLVLSTAAVATVSAHTAGWSRWSHTIAVEGANGTAYASLWIVQYLLLDRILFARRGDPARAADGSSAFVAGPPLPTTPDRTGEPILVDG